MTKPQTTGAIVATGDAPTKDELSRLVKTIARQAAREAFHAFMEALESAADHAATPSDASTHPEQAPQGTADRAFEREERFLSVAEVAERLDVSEKSVRRKIAAGELSAHRVGRLLRVGEHALAGCLARVPLRKDKGI